jgi:hypothetical protein
MEWEWEVYPDLYSKLSHNCCNRIIRLCSADSAGCTAAGNGRAKPLFNNIRKVVKLLLHTHKKRKEKSPVWVGGAKARDTAGKRNNGDFQVGRGERKTEHEVRDSDSWTASAGVDRP